MLRATAPLLRLFADLCARLDVVFDRLVKGISQRFNSVRMKADAIADTDNPPGKDTIFIVIPDTG